MKQSSELGCTLGGLGKSNAWLSASAVKMTQAGILIAVVWLCTVGCGNANHALSSVADESEIQRLESAKWHPSSLGAARAFTELFADDFVTVEYGSNPLGLVERKFNSNTRMSGPEGVKFRELLDQTHFDLSDWRFIHIDSSGIIASYQVNAPAFGWKAYATSAWAKRENQWKTVFYQASRAK